MTFPSVATRRTALPRVSLNGAYQDCDFTDVPLTGAPFAMFNGLQRVMTS